MTRRHLMRRGRLYYDIVNEQSFGDALWLSSATTMKQSASSSPPGRIVDFGAGTVSQSHCGGVPRPSRGGALSPKCSISCVADLGAEKVTAILRTR